MSTPLSDRVEEEIRYLEERLAKVKSLNLLLSQNGELRAVLDAIRELGL